MEGGVLGERFRLCHCARPCAARLQAKVLPLGQSRVAVPEVFSFQWNLGTDVVMLSEAAAK